MARHPFLVVVVGAWKTYHLPSGHIFIAAINRVGEIAFLGVLQEHVEEGFAVDAPVEFNLTALEPLQYSVLIIGREFAERGAIEICTDVSVDRRDSGAIEFGGVEAA